MPNKEQLNQSYPSKTTPKQGRPKRIMPDGQQPEMMSRMPSGRRRIHDNHHEGLIRKSAKKAVLRKALPYLIAGGTTGAGVGWGWNLIL